MQRKGLLHFLVTERREGWLARCLDHDFVTQADTLEALSCEIQRAIAVHVFVAIREGREPFAGMPAASQKYWDIYERSGVVITPRTGRLTLHADPPVVEVLEEQIDTPAPELRLEPAGVG
jgi:predicted RNase H-like HicB family nuclease